MNDIYLFEAEVLRFGTGEKIDVVHCLAYSLFQASHELIEYINDKSSGYSGIVELGSVKKLTEIKKIINPYFAVEMDNLDDEEDDEYDGSTPITVAKDMMEDEVMKFDCPDCKDEIKVPQRMLFPFVTCPTCSTQIWRNSIKNVGGIYIVDRNSNNKKT